MRLLDSPDHLGELPRVGPKFIEALESSGLAGRGGAGFPAGVKWRAVAQRSRGDAVILVNGAEGEPRSKKDRVLMGARPHLILDGAFIAARVLRETGFSRASPADTSAPVAQGFSPASRATFAFRLAVSRAPTAEEIDRIVASYTKQLERFRREPDAAARAIKDYAIDGIDPAEQAAWTLVANTLLNLDETLTKE